MKKIFDVIIVGAGIGGISAGIYAARNMMNYLLLSKDIGGQMYESGEILNYPGITKTTGADFTKIFSEQIQFNKLKIRREEVIILKRLKNKNWQIKTDKATYEGKSVIIASGSHPRKLNVPGEKKLSKKGVTYCVVCDGPLFAGKDVAIIGGGNSALEAADFMSRIAKKVYLITINEKIMGYKYLVERVKKLKKVKIVTSASVTEITGNKFVSGLRYKKNKKEQNIKVQAVIIEIGRIPLMNFAKNIVDLDEHNHIKVDRWARCFIDGKKDDTIYAIGDCSDVHEYQYAISAGMGITAILKSGRYLARKKQKN